MCPSYNGLMRRRTLILTLLTMLATGGGQVPHAPAGSPEVDRRVHLGMRVAAAERGISLIDQVVLVPDAATYLDEIGRWTPGRQWPVMIEDEHFAPMFVRRFAPSRVIRRAASPAPPDDARARRRIAELIVASAWGARAWSGGRDGWREVFKAADHRPPGVVLASMEDPAWPAAVALAAGRGQPLLWLDDDFGHPGDLLDRHRGDALVEAVDAAIEASGYDELGATEIEAITLCRAIAGRVELPRFDTGELEPHATMDMLGRDDAGRRFAYVGWIFGDEVRSAYVAMCSLFLDRDRAALINTYGNTESWAQYGMEDAARRLRRSGFDVAARQRDDLTLEQWLAALPDGIDADLVLMNTMGGSDRFRLADQHAFATDVPLLHVPAAVHFIHSWSMQSPTHPATIAQRWLDHGAYAYVGSMQEPYLTAFETPTELVRQWLLGAPFLPAARVWNDRNPFRRVWKLNTFGDPLMLVSRSGTRRRQVPSIDERLSLNDDASRHPGSTDPDSVRTLLLLGRDDDVVRRFRAARQAGDVTPALASLALGPLFRTGDDRGFVEAIAQVDSPGAIQLEMLWHLLTPRVGTDLEDSTIALLEEHIRPSMPEVDLERLAPDLERVFGRDRVLRVVDRFLKEARGARQRRLAELRTRLADS